MSIIGIEEVRIHQKTRDRCHAVSLANRETAVLSSEQSSCSRSGETEPAETLSQYFDAIYVSNRTTFLTGMHCFKSDCDQSMQRCVKSNTRIVFIVSCHVIPI